MKHIFLLYFLFGLGLSALAQESGIDTSYYTPPPQRSRILTEDPEQNPSQRRQKRNLPGRNRHADNFPVHQLREVQTWYAAVEGGFRTDGSTLSNSFNGLVSTTSQTKSSWGILMGYTYRNAWAVEGGYTHSPIHLNITIPNGSVPLVYTYQNSGYGIPVRVKRRIGSGKQTANGTGFWLSAGVWLIPNGDGQPDDFRLIGYTYSGPRSRTADTIRLTNNTTINRFSGLAEAGADYAIRLSPFFELGAYVRTYWGLGTALRSDLIYTVNKTNQQQASITADGTGWGFGIALRYIYGRQQELKKP